MWRVMSQFLDERFEDVAWKDSTYSSRIEDYDYRLHFVVFYSSQKVKLKTSCYENRFRC